jgi:hypothetical protein
MLKWPQRVSAAIGIARGIQFLHNLTAPDVVQNDLNIENILLDKTLTSKISDFNLPMISISKNGKVSSKYWSSSSVHNQQISCNRCYLVDILRKPFHCPGRKRPRQVWCPCRKKMTSALNKVELE